MKKYKIEEFNPVDGYFALISENGKGLIAKAYSLQGARSIVAALVAFGKTAEPDAKVEKAWISVQDGMPHERETVLVYFDGEYQTDMLVDCPDQPGLMWEYLFDQNITHWMPLPEQPALARRKEGA